jgi:sec-independent protein translocase protein TatA
MGSFSIWHWLVVLAVILVLFGGGNKISGLMGDFAKGIKSFKKNMAEPEDASMEESTVKRGDTLAGPAAPAPTPARETSATR